MPPGCTPLIRKALVGGGTPRRLTASLGCPVAATKTKAVTQLLLSAGADSKLRTKDGDDALALAKARGFTAVVDVFEKPTLSFKVVGGPGDEE